MPRVRSASARMAPSRLLRLPLAIVCSSPVISRCFPFPLDKAYSKFGRLTCARNHSPVTQANMIRAQGVDPFALQLPKDAARLSFARYVEQLARAPLHCRRFGSPAVEEPARVVEGSRPLRVRNRDRLLMVQAREGVGIGCRASLGNERR